MVDGDDAGTMVDTGRLDPTTASSFWAVREVPEQRDGGRRTGRPSPPPPSRSTTRGSPPASGSRRSPCSPTSPTELVTQPPGGRSPPTPAGPSAPRTSAPDRGRRPADRHLARAGPAGQLRRSPTTRWSTSGADRPVLDHGVRRLDGAVARRSTGLTNGAQYDVRVAAVSTRGNVCLRRPVRHPDGGDELRAAVASAPQPSPDAPSPTADPSGTPGSTPCTTARATNGAWPGTGAPPAVAHRLSRACR